MALLVVLVSISAAGETYRTSFDWLFARSLGLRSFDLFTEARPGAAGTDDCPPLGRQDGLQAWLYPSFELTILESGRVMSADGSGDTRRTVVGPLRNKSLLLTFLGGPFSTDGVGWVGGYFTPLGYAASSWGGCITTSTIKKTGYVLPFIYSWLLFENGEEVLLLVPMTWGVSQWIRNTVSYFCFRCLNNQKLDPLKILNRGMAKWMK